MGKVIKQNQVAIRYQPDGPSTEWSIFRLGESSATGKSNPGPGKTPVYVTDRFGRPVVGFSSTDPPGGIPSMTVTFWEKPEVSFLEKQRALGCDMYLQIAQTECGALDNPNMWTSIDHFGKGLIGDLSPGDGPSVPYSGSEVSTAATINFDYMFRVTRVSLSQLTTTEAQDLLALAVLGDPLCNDCGNGYPGADKIAYIACEALGGATANILYTVNGGGSWTTTSADPFAIAENASTLAWDWIDSNKFRLLVGCGTTDAGAKAKIAKADVTLGAEGTTAWTSVVSASASGATGEFVTALAWLFHDRVYIATDAGEIYVSEDQGDSWDAAAYYTGSAAIYKFAKSPDGSHVWAVGASNAILREVNQANGFAARVGPSGGGEFRSIAVANDGTLYAGNGTSIFKSVNEAENTGGWTSLKNFGANHRVIAIGFRGGEASRGGDSQCVWAVVDDTTPGAGELWESLDGGASWRQISELANLGYNDAFFSQVDNNKVLIVGDTDAGSVGAIHLAS